MIQDHQEKVSIQMLQDVHKVLSWDNKLIQRVLMPKLKLLKQELIMQKQIVDFIIVKFQKELKDILRIFKE